MRMSSCVEDRAATSSSMRSRSTARSTPQHRAHRLAAEEDVGAGIQVLAQRQVLVDRLDARVAGIVRVARS